MIVGCDVCGWFFWRLYRGRQKLGVACMVKVLHGQVGTGDIVCAFQRLAQDVEALCSAPPRHAGSCRRERRV